MGARSLCLTLRRVDRRRQQIELRLAAPMRDPPAFCPVRAGVGEVDAGLASTKSAFQATLIEPPMQQIRGRQTSPDQYDQLNDLITRIGTHIGLEMSNDFLPADSHIPDAPSRLHPHLAPRAVERLRPRVPVRPDVRPHRSRSRAPHTQFRWRRMRLTVAVPPPNGSRQTGSPMTIGAAGCAIIEGGHARGRRLWLFHTPQSPAGSSGGIHECGDPQSTADRSCSFGGDPAT